ncbi:MAG: PLDc N-terminal domain-containing protein, partial [Rhizobium sp.]|nr:PLDc N-terminal domain-containing protein [Rhizobium sp.]
MFELLSPYWPHILAFLSITMGAAAAIHAAMTKREVRSAIGWVGVIVLSPLLGALIYAVAGVNRIRRKSLISRRALHLDELWRTLSHYGVSRDEVETRFGSRMAGLKTLGDRVAKHALSSGNRIDMLSSGDETYAAFCAAIDAAERSIILETYIFDRDTAGLRVADRLIAAHKRGVSVRVLIDAVGARYSVPSIPGYLAEGGVTVAAFNGKVVAGLRLPYANLRTHRKILVVDGAVALLGGMNIRAAFEGDEAARDTHFRLTGPAVADLFAVAAEDWHFETGHILNGDVRNVAPNTAEPGTPSFLRTEVSGPHTNLETNHKKMMGAISVAEKTIRIKSHYFNTHNILIAAHKRGVSVRVLIDAVGARNTVPSITGYKAEGGVTVARIKGQIV